MRLLEVLSAAARGMLGSILTDVKLISVYALVVLVIITANKKYMELKDNLGIDYGKSKWRLLEESILTGLVSGFILSVICLILGITMRVEKIDYFIFIMILLAVINIRFVSFVYAAGGLIIISAITGSPGIDALSLLILTGLVQLTEAILTFLYGKTDAIPVYIKTKDRIAGAFVIRKVWPVPIVFFTYLFNEMLTIVQSGQQSEWWTLLKPDDVIPAAAILGLDCLIAVAGYWDIVVTEKPELRCKKVSLQYAGIAVFLLLASAVAYRKPAVAPIAVLIAIAAREGLVIWGRRAQKTGEPFFASVDRGLRLLDVTFGGNANKLGLEKGDIILAVNGKDIQTIEGLKAVLDDSPRYVWIVAQKPDGSRKTYEKSFYPYGINSLGVLTVPREREVTYNMDSYENLVILKNLVRRFRGISRSMKD